MPAKPAKTTKTRKRPIRAEDLLRFQLVSDPQISPDGRHLLFTRKTVGKKNDYETQIWLVPCEGGEPRPFTHGPRDGQARWSPDGSRVAFSSGRDKPRAQVYLVRTDGGEATPLTRFPEGSIGEIKWSPDGKQIAVAFREADPEWTEEARKKREEKGLSSPPRVIDQMWYRLDGDGYFNRQRHHLYLVDASTGEARKVFDRGRAPAFDFDWSPDGRELAIVANLHADAMLEPWRDRLYRLDARSGKLRLVPGQTDGIRDAVAWSPDGKLVAWAGREGRTDIWGSTNTHLFVCDPEGGGARNLTGAEDYCLLAPTLGDTREAVFRANLRWHPRGARVFFALGWHGESNVASVDARRGGRVAFHTRGRGELGLGNWSRDGRRLAMTVGSALEITEAAVGVARGGAAGGGSGASDLLETRKLTRLNVPLLGQLQLSEPEEHWVDSTGGTRVHAWVMKPIGFQARRRWPAVLEVHGGPHGQYGLTFFHEFQLLAANGYAVFFSNPRGSKGYGEKHSNAIRGAWGGVDWDDVQAVAGFMRLRRWVDGARMGIMGGSYGGFMTNWAIGHGDLFAGAITDRSVSNLLSMAGTSDFPLVPGQYWDGAPWDRPEALLEQSPIRHLAKAKTPTLVIHSEGDLRCNVEQAEQVFSALQVLGVPSRFVRYPASSSHGMSRAGPPDLRLHRLGQILAWWKKWLR